MINAEQRKLARIEVLRAIRAGRGFANKAVMLLALKTAGFRSFTDDDVNTGMIQYLLDTGHIVAREQAISPECRVYRITAAGQNYLAEEGYDE